MASISILTRCGLALVFGATLGAFGGCASVPTGHCAPSRLAYIGTDGGQLQAIRLDACAGKLANLGTMAQLAKPRWSVANPALPLLYVANDIPDKDGSVVTFAVDRESGSLTKLDEVDAGGIGTTHLWLDAQSATLIAAHYGSGSATTLPLLIGGRIGAVASTVKETGSGPSKRQTKAHAHAIALDPTGAHALVPDLGADRVFVYGFDRASHALSPDDTVNSHAFAVPPGSGPRHAAFSPDGRFVYLMNELVGDIRVLQWNASDARLTAVQTVPISSVGYQGAKSGAEIAVSRDGRFVYVEDRGENALVVYRRNADSGELALQQRIPSGGDKPWAFAIDPSGRWMLVANADKVSLFGIDAATGALVDTGQAVPSAMPLSIAFMP
jgi:6-phosphogluconolactonase